MNLIIGIPGKWKKKEEEGGHSGVLLQCCKTIYVGVDCGVVRAYDYYVLFIYIFF